MGSSRIEQIGRREDRDGEPEALAHAARVAAHRAARGVAEPDPLEHVHDALSWHAARRREEAEHLLARQVLGERDSLGQIADALLQVVVHLARASVDDELPGVRPHQAEQHADQRGFARAVRAREHHGLAGIDLEIDVDQRRKLAEAHAGSDKREVLHWTLRIKGFSSTTVGTRRIGRLSSR